MNKKKCLRIVSLLMAVLLFSVCFLTSCKDKNGSDDSTGDVIKLSEYQIVHPKSASEKVTAAAETLKKGLSVDLAVTDDSAAADESKKEILLGLTDRAETTAALEEIPAGKYGIAVRGNKIIILAREDAILGDAVQYFLNLCGNKSEIELADNYLHLSDAYPFLNIVTNGKSNYTIVSGANAPEAVGTLVTQIREAIYNLTGVRNISMEPDSGGPDERFFSKNCTYSISLTLNGKDESIERITDAMNLIHSRVTRSPWYPSAPKWQILRVGTQNAPVLIERQDDGMWVYGSALSVEFFFRGDD